VSKKHASKPAAKRAVRHVVCVVTSAGRVFDSGCRAIVSLDLAARVAQFLLRHLRYTEEELEFESAPEWAWDIRRILEGEHIDLTECTVVVMPTRPRKKCSPLVAYAVAT
jgi:hypothetical protein